MYNPLHVSSKSHTAEVTFEKALEELESLVAYQRGAELIKYCESRLADAQARIAILDGGELRDFNPEK